MPSRLPKVFVGCSVEGLPLARHVQDQLQHEARVQLWNQGIFQLSSSVLDDLLLTLEAVDAAVFLLSSDDLVKMRGQMFGAARDNVLFELGLFMGKLGRDRTFFVMPRDSDFRIPTDLMGVTGATYDSVHAREDGAAAMGPVCGRLCAALGRLARKPPTAQVQMSRTELRRQIANCLKLYKATLATLRNDLGRVRLHVLKYDPALDRLTMHIQDDVYEDRSFCVAVETGLANHVVVCEAARKVKLVARDLPVEHASHYPDESIPFYLKSVVAYPLLYRRQAVAGVLAIDGELTLAEYGVERQKFMATFVRLCALVEQLIWDHEDSALEL